MSKWELTAELLAAAYDCGKSLQKDLALPRLATLCEELADSLLTRSWRPSESTRFAVREPKVREIFAPGFADRVVEAWLVALVKALLENRFINDTYANRPGKGPLAAIRKAQREMRRPGHDFCLQLDVQNFFHSIHRPTLLRHWLEFLRGRPLDPNRLELAEHISTVLLTRSSTDHFHTVRSSLPLLAALPRHKNLINAPADTGLPIGSVASQHFANFYLGGLDHFVKHQLRIKGYLRYMDDLMLFGPDSTALLRWKEDIAAYLRDNLRLTPHPRKEQLSVTGQGIDYLGYRVYPHHVHMADRNVKALKARLDYFKHLFWPERFPHYQRPSRGIWPGLEQRGELRPPVVPDWPLLKRMEATINSYYGLMGHAKSYTLRRTLYHKHFGPLRAFFIPADSGYGAVHAKKYFLVR